MAVPSFSTSVIDFCQTSVIMPVELAYKKESLSVDHNMSL